MKYTLSLICLIMMCSCMSERDKDPDELVLHEMIVEKNGIYYWGDCDIHATTRYTGTDTCYHYDNGKIKATYTIKNGIPEGHWEQFDTSGKKVSDLYYDHGVVIQKVTQVKSPY